MKEENKQTPEQILGKYQSMNEYPDYYHESTVVRAMEEYAEQFKAGEQFCNKPSIDDLEAPTEDQYTYMGNFDEENYKWALRAWEKLQAKPSIDLNSLRDKFFKKFAYWSISNNKENYSWPTKQATPEEIFDWFKNQLEEAGSLPLNSEWKDKFYRDWTKWFIGRQHYSDVVKWIEENVVSTPVVREPEKCNCTNDTVKEFCNDWDYNTNRCKRDLVASDNNNEAASVASHTSTQGNSNQQNKVAKISTWVNKILVNNTDGDVLFRADTIEEAEQWCVDNDYDIEETIKTTRKAKSLNK